MVEMDTYTECLGPGNKCPINANFLLSFSQEKKCPKLRLATKMLISGVCPCVRINSINFVVKLGRKKGMFWVFILYPRATAIPKSSI